MRSGGRSRSISSRGGRCQNGAIARRQLGRAGARAGDLLDRLDAVPRLNLAQLEGAVAPAERVVVEVVDQVGREAAQRRPQLAREAVRRRRAGQQDHAVAAVEQAVAGAARAVQQPGPLRVRVLERVALVADAEVEPGARDDLAGARVARPGSRSDAITKVGPSGSVGCAGDQVAQQDGARLRPPLRPPRPARRPARSPGRPRGRVRARSSRAGRTRSPSPSCRCRAPPRAASRRPRAPRPQRAGKGKEPARRQTPAR